MCSVDCPIHSHSGLKGLQLLVFSDPCEDGSQGGSNQISRSEGDDGADVLDSDAVIIRGIKTQLLQDVPGVLQTIFIPGNIVQLE